MWGRRRNAVVELVDALALAVRDHAAVVVDEPLEAGGREVREGAAQARARGLRAVQRGKKEMLLAAPPRASWLSRRKRPSSAGHLRGLRSARAGWSCPRSACGTPGPRRRWSSCRTRLHTGEREKESKREWSAKGGLVGLVACTRTRGRTAVDDLGRRLGSHFGRRVAASVQATHGAVAPRVQVARR